MSRNAYTVDEVVICAYIALYEGALLSEKKIAGIGKRSEGSIKMKVQNIAAMLDDKKVSRNAKVSALAGLPSGESGRETDWPSVQGLVALGKKEHWSKCKEIIANHAK
jgi:hypothetical protein